MYSYTFIQWVLFFYIYCFVGWIIESTIVSVETKHFVNRGFLRGPFLPLYGFGALAILFSTLPFRDNPILVYFFGMLSTTVLEYFTGWLMESILKMKYWDYSKRKFNLKGRICLRSSLFWGFLSLFLIYMLHAAVEDFVLSLSNAMLIAMFTVLTVFIVSDAVYAFKTAFDMNKFLAKMEDIRTELEEKAVLLENRVENSEYVQEIRSRVEELKAERREMVSRLGYFKRSLINAHPTAVSDKFNESLKELRLELREKIEEKLSR